MARGLLTRPDMSRVIPSPWNQVGGLLVALSLGACAVGDDERELGPQDREEEAEDDKATAFRAEAITIRDHFVAIHHHEYRERMFAVLRGLSESKPATAFGHLEVLLEVAEAGGADGLQTLIVAHADALAHSEYAGATMELIAEYSSEKVTTSLKSQPLNVLEPLGRASTRMVLNTRADTAGMMLSTLLENPELLDMDDLLSNKGLQQDICDELGGKSAELASEALMENDGRMQQACEEIAGGGGGQAGALAGGMSGDACLNIDLSGARNTFGDNEDGYGMDDQAADMAACVDGMFPGGTARVSGQNFALGPAIPVILKIISELGGDEKETGGLLEIAVKEGAGTARDLANIAAKAYVDHLSKQADHQLQMEKASNKLGQDIAGLGAEISNLDGQIGDLNSKINKVQSQLNQFEGKDFRTLPDGTITNKSDSGTTKEDLEKEKSDLQKQRDEKQGERDEKQKQKEIKEAIKEQVDEQKKNGNNLEPFSNEACERAMLGGKTFAEAKLGDDWTSWEKRLEPVVNPDPTGPVPGDEPRDGLGLPNCGQGGPSRGSACEQLVLCAEGQQCGCSGKPGESPTSEQEIAAITSQASLCSTMQCAEGEPELRGATCVCQGYGADDPDGMPTPPAPPVVTSMTESFFVNADERPAHEGDGPLNGIMDGFM